MDFEKRSTFLLLLMLLATTVIFNRLDFGNLPSYDDAYYAQKGKEIIASGDIWTMTFAGVPRFDNPPGFIWMEAISFKVFGVSEFSARFPSALAAVLGIVGTFFLFELLFTTRIGLLAGLVLTFTTVYLKYARHSMMDTSVAAAGVWCFYYFIRGNRGSQWWYLLAGLFGSYIFFAKSAFGGLPPIVLLAYLIASKQFVPLKKPGFWLGVVLLPLPYLIWCANQYGQFADQFIQQHFINLIIYASKQRGANDYWYDYIIVLLKYFPLFLPFMLWGTWICLQKIFKNFKWGSEELRPYLFSILFFVVFFVCLTMQGTKKTWYFIPAFPACAGLAAIALDRTLKKYSIGGIAKFIGVVFVILFTVSSGTLLMRPNPRAVDTRRLAPYVRAAGEQGFNILGLEIDYFGMNNSLLFYSDYSAKNVTENEMAEALASEEKVMVVMNPGQWSSVQPNHPTLKVLRVTPEMVLVTNHAVVQDEVF